MADGTNLEEKVVFTGDASQLTLTFDQLVNAITKTREELKLYKDDKEKSAQLSQQLYDQEMQLVDIMKKNNNVIDASNVSYRQLNDILKDLNKTYRSTSDAAQRMNIAPASKAINAELKQMDANIGNYQRNVGNYASAVDKAMTSVKTNATQVLRELPSLKYGVEMFFLAISNNLPMLIESLERLKTARAAEKAASAGQVAQDAIETKSKQGVAGANAALSTSRLASAKASDTERKAEIELIQKEIEENQVTLQGIENDLKATKASKEKALADLAQAKAQFELYSVEKDRAVLNREQFKTLGSLEAQARERMKAIQQEIDRLEGVEAAQLKELKIATDELTAAQDRLNVAMTKGKGEAGVAGAAGAAAKSFSSWANIAVILVTILALFSRQIIEFLAPLFKSAKYAERNAAAMKEAGVSVKELGKNSNESTIALRKMSTALVNSADDTKLLYKEQKELNKAMMEGAKSMAQRYVEIRLLDSIIKDAAKSEEDHTKAAAKLVEILDEAGITTNDVKNQTEAYDTAVNKLIEDLYKQAQAQGAVQLLQQKYTETVLKVQGELIEAELQKQLGEIKGFWNNVVYWFTNSWKLLEPGAAGEGISKEDWLDKQVEKWEKKLGEARAEFEVFLAEVVKMFNFDELFANDGGNGGKDNWFSKWEMFIKKAEALKGTLVGEFQNVNLAEAWKYSQEGLEAYMNKFDEYVAHYKGDIKQLKELEIQRIQYIEERYRYQQKLINQYAHSDATEKQRDLDSLEEWYEQQLIIYEMAGVETTNLEAEYARRKEDILDKYIDKYRNIDMQRQAIDERYGEYHNAMMDIELKNLDDTMDKEIKEYQRKGIETTNLEEYYALERLKIISKYAADETKAVIGEIQKQEDYRQRQNQVELGWANMGGANYKQELNYARFGGTTMTGHQQRQNEINATFNEYNIWSESTQQQIAAMEEVLASGKLIGEEKLQMEQALADAQKELALGTAEYQMELNQMVLEDTRMTTQETLSTIQSSFQGLGSAFDDVYTAVEKTMEMKVKEGKMSNEEAEKELEKYRGIKAAAAAMDALSAAVGAYNSMASIPYVGPALGAVAAAAALAAGFANVKQILATTKDNAGSGNNNFANAAPSLSEYTPQVVTNVTGRDDTDYLRNSLDEKPLRAFVVESDISAAQELASQRNSETSF